MKRLIIVLLLVFTCFNPSFAQRGKPKLPVVIEAQKLTYNDVQKRAVYVGNVVAQHGKTILNGDKLIIYFTKDGKEIKKIVVMGNIHIKSEKGEGWCDQLVYYPAQEKAVLIGNAKLKQGKNILVGDRIVAYKSGRVEVVGQKRRVKTVIFPEEKGGESKRP